jgi:uncharacterized YccA/Bax inhibitor family protein
VQSSNPVLTRLGEAARQERAGSAGYQTGHGYGIAPPDSRSRMMTLDDVVVRTVALLAITGIAGALSWILLPASSQTVMLFAVVGSSIAGLVLGLVIAFARITNPLVISLYAIVEGVLLGVVSRYFEHKWPGIVIQAMIGTFGIFAIMTALYKFRVLRATPRFARGVIGALIGVVVLSLANWFAAAFFDVNLGLIQTNPEGKVGWLPIVFSLVCIVVGALTFILDFDAVEQGVRYGLPERYAWYCSFGLLVGLIFLYWQILRLLSYLRW